MLFVSRRAQNFELLELIADESYEEFVIRIFDLSKSYPFDPICKFVSDNWENIEKKRMDMRKIIVAELYRAGVVSVKLNTHSRHSYSFKDSPVIDPAQIDDNSKISIHPAYHSALNINSRNKKARR